MSAWRRLALCLILAVLGCSLAIYTGIRRLDDDLGFSLPAIVRQCGPGSLRDWLAVGMPVRIMDCSDPNCAGAIAELCRDWRERAAPATRTPSGMPSGTTNPPANSFDSATPP
jgi:hypothetical protein